MQHEELTKVLIVDDLPQNLRALDAIIRSADRQIFYADSGDQALSLLLEHDFALAILDVQMPGMDGFELAELMRGTERTRHIPIVFVTAAGKELDYAFKGYETGAVDFLYKPLDIGAVRSKVNVFATLYQKRNESRRQVIALEESRIRQDILLKELNGAQEELRRAVRMRDDFMSIVAHELRTPLNTLFLESQMRSLQLGRGNMDFFDQPNQQRMVASDRRQIESMLRLIEDMMDVSRIRSGQLSIRRQATDLAPLVERVVGDLAAQANSAGVSITLHPTPQVTGLWDEFRLEQMLVNLLTNAIRYGANKPVAVYSQVVANTVRISVQDRGIGISTEDLQRIFEPFERGSRTKSAGGLGLGLYIMHQLAEAHGGSVDVESTLGEGSTFTITLPLDR